MPLRYDVSRIAASDINSDPSFGFSVKVWPYFYNSNSSWESAKSLCGALHERALSGFIGPSISSAILSIEGVTTTVRLPVISPAATSDYLARNGFARPCPTNAAFAQAMLTAIRSFGWGRVGIIYSAEDDYGVNGFNDLHSVLEAGGVSVVSSIPVTGEGLLRAGPSSLPDGMGVFKNVRVIVAWLKQSDFLEILPRAKNAGLLTAGYVWLCSETILNIIVAKEYKGLLAINFEMPTTENSFSLLFKWRAQFPSSAPVADHLASVSVVSVSHFAITLFQITCSHCPSISTMQS